MRRPLLVGFLFLAFVMVATLIYTISIDGLPFRRDLLTPWMAATLVDFILTLQLWGIKTVAWISYKEPNFISAAFWIVLLVCFGSITTCIYIVIQLLKLPPLQSWEDLMYHVLLRHDKPTRGEAFPCGNCKSHLHCLGFLMLGTLVYTIVTAGSPFKELLNPWMDATLIDFYINVLALSVWVTYKESTWFSASIWIIFFLCFGSLTTCVYIVRQLSKLTTQDPIYLVLLKRGNMFLLLIGQKAGMRECSQGTNMQELIYMKVLSAIGKLSTL
ncbi:hypothetical protein K2173_014515 [Erythroxylum novogranatense]|uniref:Uncharacterized protein n=1 Tax=Erythroxylum novogranatense TaxID=1862640 RepID=A0AAV8S6T3_9ROSI|nr:hypothetical protein K2173_014515 [Erythroxylum novogranatense]